MTKDRSAHSDTKEAIARVCRSVGAEIDFGSDIPVYRQIEASFEGVIESGQLEQGAKLPPERALMEILGVSRSTLRAALAALIERRYISATQGRGNFVTAPEQERPLRFLALEKFHADHWQVSPVHYDWISNAAKSNGVQIHYHYVPTLEELFQTLNEPPPGYDGLIIFRSLPEWSTALARLSEAEQAHFPKPVMVIGRPIRLPLLNAITYDYFEASRQATLRLIAEGHSKIGLISGSPSPGHSFHEFYEGYKAALTEKEIAPDDKRALLIKGHLFQGGATPQRVTDHIGEFLNTTDATGAVVCLLTASFEKAALKQRIVIPEGFSAIAVTEEHALSTGALRWTAMSEPSAQIVERGVQLLAEICRGRRQHGVYEVVAPTYHPGRTSCACPPRTAADGRE